MLKSFASDRMVCGVDEAGRGCLAGPVVAAAVILPKYFRNEILNDSKQLNEKQRDELRPVIEEHAISFAVGIIDNHIIDKVNILQATYLAMHEAIGKLNQTPALLIIDGNRFKPYKQIPHHTIIKGDATYFEIAAASVLAKTYRDELMKNLSFEFPVYQWEKNKGYGTVLHRDAIREHGSCIHHRQSFQLLK